MTRFEDWPRCLELAVASAKTRTFRYGEWDCCIAVADLVLAMTGTDIAVRWRGRYRTRKEALDIAQRETSKRSLRVFLGAALCELPCVPVAYAQRGDIVLVKRSASDVSLGVVDLTGRNILAASKAGFLSLPLQLGVRAWHV